MNDENNKLKQSALLISKHFGISQSEFDIENQNYAVFLTKLTQIINYLLEKDFQKLLNGLYRIDVSEQKVNEVLHHSAPNAIAKNIAQLVLDRELKKIETRIRYKK